MLPGLWGQTMYGTRVGKGRRGHRAAVTRVIGFRARTPPWSTQPGWGPEPLPYSPPPTLSKHGCFFHFFCLFSLEVGAHLAVIFNRCLFIRGYRFVSGLSCSSFHLPKTGASSMVIFKLGLCPPPQNTFFRTGAYSAVEKIDADSMVEEEHCVASIHMINTYTT